MALGVHSSLFKLKSYNCVEPPRLNINTYENEDKFKKFKFRIVSEGWLWGLVLFILSPSMPWFLISVKV